MISIVVGGMLEEEEEEEQHEDDFSQPLLRLRVEIGATTSTLPKLNLWSWKK